MKKVFNGIVLMLLISAAHAQGIKQRLDEAWQTFAGDSQVKHASVSLYVIDAKTGELVFDIHSGMGMAPASTQKIITRVTSFELLGKDFRYQTRLGLEKYDGKNILHIYGSGDPTFGSWRYDSTGAGMIMSQWVKTLQDAGVKKAEHVVFENAGWQTETIPDGWIWQDIGNYYGAGATVFNWRENQYDILLKSGKNIGDEVAIVKTIPRIYDIDLQSALRSAGKNTGDNAYVYYPLNEPSAIIRGTIPVDENSFKISASFPSGFNQFLQTFADTLKGLDIKIPRRSSENVKRNTGVMDVSILATSYSPSLDQVIYWFNKKSINLYGEALVKTIGAKLTGVAATDSGVSSVKKFWKEKGIEPDELNMYDGSGLSPLNRVTTHAQVEILRYAKTREWFPYFYSALPEYNGMHMKSGTISDVKGFCGYQTSKEGREFIFSFLVNNYGGRTGSMVNKMYRVLDELK
jgi:D-alanyl-D-alanine carboxypeptidase/D-alanyl-D-alanine-endopeptidase (penicillin-binding protein 4)